MGVLDPLMDIWRVVIGGGVNGSSIPQRVFNCAARSEVEHWLGHKQNSHLRAHTGNLGCLYVVSIDGAGGRTLDPAAARGHLRAQLRVELVVAPRLPLQKRVVRRIGRVSVVSRM